jgi:hypothetical protein
MATEYDLLRSLMNRSESQNKQLSRRFDKEIMVRKLLLSWRMRVRGMRDRLSDDQRSRMRRTQMS